MKYVISVSKTFKHRGKHRHYSAKKYWFVYWLDEDWQLHCEQVNFLQALYYKTQKWHRKKFYCMECGSVFIALVKSKKTQEVECPYCLE